MAFCRWLSWRLTGRIYTLEEIAQWAVRLPTEIAARGKDGRIYPYEGEFDAGKGNTNETGIGGTSAVGIFPAGASPYGVLDMSGNVWEWCLTDNINPALEAKGENSHSNVGPVLRSGSWNWSYAPDSVPATYRNIGFPFDRVNNFGFRVCRPPSR
jgi:formylglycine-generating enzyme required for sulfatase activity